MRHVWERSAVEDRDFFCELSHIILTSLRVLLGNAVFSISSAAGWPVEAGALDERAGACAPASNASAAAAALATDHLLRHGPQAPPPATG